MKNTVNKTSIKKDIQTKRAEIREIVRVMANKASYERIAELNKKLSVALRDLSRLETRANILVA